MGTIKPAFWTCRFIITPEEFANFAKKCYEHKLNFFFVEATFENSFVPCEKAIHQYEITYNNMMFQKEIETGNYFAAYYIRSNSFKNGLSIIQSNYGKLPFVQISSPKGYAVNESDGIHFYYEDICKIEPQAELVFKELTEDIKKSTKPLYDAGHSIYSIRISKSVWNHMKDNPYFIKHFPNLSCNW